MLDNDDADVENPCDSLERCGIAIRKCRKHFAGVKG